jgi:hypothetical protein
MGLFAFLLGAVSSLVVAFILLVNFLNKVEEKVQQEYEEAKKAAGEPDMMVCIFSLHLCMFHSTCMFLITRGSFNKRSRL